MKKHAIIPIFIPNMGCNLSCVFCDQKQITARTSAPSTTDVRKTIDTWLSTILSKGNDPTVEIAFYGGSFTAIPDIKQDEYLSVAKEYLDRGLISGIHISTRPDCIDSPTLKRLSRHGVRTIELGVQSFSDDVLTKSKRGHDSSAVYRACDLIKASGDFKLGIQLMVGLPGDSMETAIFSARETAKIRPELARIYPTLVLEGTELMTMYRQGTYIPLSRHEAVERTKAMYNTLSDAGIYIMRVGLKSTDIINSDNLGELNSGAYHPAFRQLVESEISKDRIIKELENIEDTNSITDNTSPVALIIKSSADWFSNMIGQHGSNRVYFEENYPNIKFKFCSDDSLNSGEFKIEKLD